ncbi:MAG: DUF2723 domain-containing protein [Myxococcales bacterium]|nr:DUF2723 domain-containing protein [Myxococcales bacterium]
MSRAALLAVAAGLPLSLYVATVGDAGYWLDSGEFVAAVAMLDVAHPPGHPLAILWGKLFCLLPLGPAAFRVGLGQAVAAGAAAGFLFLAIRRSALSFRGVGETIAAVVALAGTWLPMLSYSHWFQAVRPEVYALQGALLLAAAHQLTRLFTQEQADPRPLYAACLYVGLALANHHFMAFLLFPALLFAAGTIVLRRGLRPILTSAACGLLGLGVYAYLPARASARPPVNLGDPISLERIYWVVSAKVYAKNMGEESYQPMGERLIDVLVALVESLHAPFVLVALAGVYLGLRHAATRSIAILWILISAVALYLRAWVGPVRGNPDALGYMFAAFAAVAALVALALAVLAGVLAVRARARDAVLGLYAMLLAGIVGYQVSSTWPRVDLGARHAVEAFDAARIERLPPRAAVVATSPSTAFRFFQHAAIDRIRPDVDIVPLPFVAYPGMAERLASDRPQLAALVKDYVEHRALRAPPLIDLATRRPLLVELDLNLDPALYSLLVPEGLLQRVANRAPTLDLLTRQRRAQARAHERLYRSLAREVRDAETSRQLLWLHYTNALYFAGLGQRALAIEQSQRAALLHPADEHVRRLQTALQAWRPDRPFDLRSHLALE